MTCSDPEGVGDVYSMTAVIPESRMLISHHEGGRSTEDAIALFRDIEQKRKKSWPLPVFVSDDWDPFAKALLNIYGIEEIPLYKRVGRKPNPVLVPPPDLKYAQNIKYTKNDEVIYMSHRIVYGDPKEILEQLTPNSEGHIHTAYAERINLAFRNHLARFIRETMNFSKDRENHSNAVDFFQAWYNFIKPHDSLKIEINLNMEEVGFQQNPKKWIFQTYAMVEFMTDHIWDMEELMNYRVPFQ